MNFPNSEPNFHDINESFESLSVNSPYHYEQVEYFESQHLADSSEYYDQSASQVNNPFISYTIIYLQIKFI